MRPRSILMLGVVLVVVLVAYWARRHTAQPSTASSKTSTSNVGLTNAGWAINAASTNSNRPGQSQSREFDLSVNPYAGGLKQPGQSKCAWDAGFLKSFQKAAIGDPIRFELTAGRMATGSIRITQFKEGELTYMSGVLSEPESGKFFFLKPPEGGKAGKAVGVVEFPASETAYRIEPTGPNGDPELWGRRLDEVVCVGMPRREAAATSTNLVVEAPPLRPDSEWIYVPSYNTNLNGVGIISLQSNPGSKAVLLLDFFGGSTPTWGGVNYAPPSAANNLTIRDLWKRVAEDFIPFNINVTTDIKVYEAASPSSRQRCCFTDTPVTAAGVAYEGSWNWGGDTPCWSVYSTGKSGAEVGAHEPGHTLGLSHESQEIPDGTSTTHVEYYEGHGSGATGWAPIMGVGYYRQVATWSKGEFQYASNLENQLNTIATANNDVTYRADDSGSTLATARYLDVYPDSTVFAEGVIERTADTDAFKFTTTGGQVALFANPVGDWANLAIMATLANATDIVIASNSPQSSLSGSIITNLPAGTYTFRVTGAGRNNAATTGFSDYGSLGYYSISGSIAGVRQPSRLEVMEHSTNGTVVGTIVASVTNGTLAYSIVSGNSNNTFAVDNSGVVRVANNTLLDFDMLAVNTLFPVQFELFVNITNLSNPAFNELNRRVVISVLNETVNNPIGFTGFNAGVIVPYNATLSTPKATGFDVPNNWCFYQSGLNGNPQVGGSGGSQGLPQSGSFSSLYDNTVFRLGPYGGMNALMMGAGYPSSGTLTFTAPKSYSSIAILAASANGGGIGTLAVTFTDGKSQMFNFNAQDWYGTAANVAIQGFGRLRLGQSTLLTESPNSDPRFYQTTLNLAALGLNRPVASISFTNVTAGGNQSCGIFALSGVVMPPQLQITAQPQSLTNTAPAQGAAFTAAAMGSYPLGWQWYFSTDGAAGTYSPLAGQTNSSLVLSAELQANNVGSYFAVVTNISGAATSSVARLTLFRAPVITQQPAPANLSLFTGQKCVLSVGVNAALPLTCYWKKDGAVVASGSSPNYTVNNLQLANAGNYSVTLSNAYGMATSSVVVMTVLASPTNYVYPTIADKPLGYWRLDETSGNVAHDYIDGNNGVYNNVAVNQPGHISTDSNRAAGFGPTINSYVGGIPIDFGTNENRSFSIEVWVKGNAQSTDAGIVCRGTGGGGEQFNLDTGGSGHAFRFFIRDSFGGAHVASGTVAPNGLWHHVVGVCDKTNLLVVLYVDGVSNASAEISVGNGILKTASPMTIGSRQSGTGSYNNQFVGTIDEVAVYNYALSPAQIKTHYATQTNLLDITTHPVSQTAYLRDTVQLSVAITGIQPLSYQWRAGNSGLYANLADGGRFSGVKQATLVISDITLTDAKSYVVVVTNTSGAVTSNPAILTVLSSTRPVVALKANDASGSSGFIVATNWSNDAIPTMDYNYLVNGVTLRTIASPSGSSNSFQGRSLTLRNGATISYMSDNLSTVSFGTSPGTGLTLDNGRWLVIEENKNYTLAGFVVLGAGGGFFDPWSDASAIISAQISGQGAFSLVRNGSSPGGGTQILSGVNTYTGGTIINSSNTLLLAGAGTLGASNNSLSIVNTASKGYGKLDLNGSTQSIGNLSGTGGTILNNGTAASTLIIGNGNTGGGVFAGVLTDGSGNVALTKTGSGTITLSGTNLYSGETSVNGGKLVLSGPGMIQNSSGIRVTNATLDVSSHSGPFMFSNSIVVNSGTFNLGALQATNAGLSLTDSILQLSTISAASTNLVTGTLSTGGTINFINIGILPAVTGYRTQCTVIKYASAPGIVDGNNKLIKLGAGLPELGNMIAYLTNNAANSSIDLVLINPVTGPVNLTNSWDGTRLTLSWPGGGQLLQATNVMGPWTTNTDAVSPLPITPAVNQMFYRLKLP